MNNITAEIQMMTAINFAMQQNYIPVIRSIKINNSGDSDAENLKLSVSFEPEFARCFEAEISAIMAGSMVEISPVKIVLSTDYLFSLTEKLTGNVHIQISSGTDVLFSCDNPIELLAYDQWTGAMIMPEMISAFVTPNHPKVSEIISKASLYLQKWCDSPSFTGYQSKNPNIVKMQAAAIYAALQSENIAYTMPPAGFEKSGQRIRLPENVLTEKHGTCLDLSVLYASCLEAARLNPLIVFLQGHAFGGVWLEEETFAECAEEDASSVAKRAAAGIDRLCLIECTDFTAGKSVDFSQSEKHGLANLDNPSEFEFAIDISRCRGSGIRPIPSRISENGSFKAADYVNQSENKVTAAPNQIDLSKRNTEASKQELTRSMIWERRLLDLSLRNSLLNFRPSSSNVQLMTADLTKLEDEVSKGESFKIMAAPSDFSLKLSDSGIFEAENGVQQTEAIAESEFKNHRIRTYISENELERTLKKLHRQAKISIEENGANTLYLALGFLRWYETEKSEKTRYAPLVLVPVDIIKKIQDRSYSLRVRDEETQMNITLLELLRQDFGISIEGLNQLPEDESGIDLQLVFNTVRKGVMAQKRWDIEETAFLGQFSFSRFIMWNDIRSRSEDLKKNKVVASLISGKTEWTPQEAELSPRILDEQLKPSDMAVPASADSSQLAAIYQASLGESFVLHGPPGTGKSQTITNMIANALYNGKSVLFVAEKMAALSVVQKRLSKIGLAPFCLELHSNKAQKKAVLSQLEKTLEVGHIKSPQEYSQTAEKLKSLRDELNSTMNALYIERGAGLSVYDAVVQYEATKDFDILPEISAKLTDNADSADFAEWKEAVKDVCYAGTELGGLSSSPLKNVRITEYNMEIRESFSELTGQLSKTAESAKSAYESLVSEIGTALPESSSGISETLDILKAVVSAKRPLTSVISGELNEAKNSELHKLIDAGIKCTAIYTDFSDKFEQSIWGYDCDVALLNWKKAQQSWFLPKMMGSNKLLKELKLYEKKSGTVTAESIRGIYDSLCEYKQLKAYINSCSQFAAESFGGHWLGENSDFHILNEALNESLRIRELINSASFPQTKTAAKIAVKNPSDKLSSAVITACTKFEAAKAAENTVCKQFGAIISLPESKDGYFDALISEANDWQESSDMLRDRSVLENALNRLKDYGLTAVADTYFSGNIDENKLEKAFVCAVSKAVISSSMKEEPLLSGFQGAKFENTIKKYRNFTARFEELTIEELAARLSAKIPDTTTGTSGSSELAILQKAIRSGGRMMPIRKLFDSIPTLLRRICPCMLMSPISVAQYIDPSYPKFDLVIFDEASQLPTCEAVGAIARGENVVVVGDPKQLPPTSFFTTNQLDEDNPEIEDLESVLDDCLALAMPQKHLLWHYRSRHESLIAYSNSKYYDSKLRTFPSPDDLVSKVSWVHVEGCYDKGATKQNPAEARAVVEEIVRRISDEKLRQNSIGVVTFSVVQQVLIDDMLAEEFRKNPELEQLAGEMHEPILVKNLENVQGDERDVILFSIGYGPDKNGKVSMNFGPINRDGGWRRLNVAISRARKEMIVFSVISPEQIDLSRTRSDGVAGLKGFLEFAARGRNSLPLRNSEAVRENRFADSVAEEIRKLGYEVKRNIGCSDYKIDIGVVNPDDKGRFVLGIMCESKNNFSITTARDRNIVQPSVLAGLGWRIMNIHILDWLDNPTKALAQLEAALKSAVETFRTNPETVAAEPVKKREIVFEKEEAPKPEDIFSTYVPYIPQTVGTPESYYEPDSDKLIAKVINEAVKAEAPVSKHIVYRYVLTAFGISRTTSKAEARFDDILNGLNLKTTSSNQSVFLWQEQQLPEEYDICRKPSANGEKRAIEDICPEELGAAVALILKNAISIERSELIKETAKIFGFSRSGDAIETAVSQGIARAVRRKKAKVDENGRIMLAE